MANAQVNKVRRRCLYIVYFKDALPEVQKQMPSLSIRSIQRRKNQCITLNKNDYPIPSTVVELLSKHADILAVSRWLNAAVIYVEPNIINEINDQPYVKNMQQLSHRFSITTAIKNTPADALYSSNNQLKMLGLDRLHAIGNTGQGKLIAVFDIGFTNVNRQDAFKNIFKEHRMVATRNFVNPSLSVFDTGGDGEHGARVLSILGAVVPPNFEGAAYNASFALAVTEDNTQEGELEEINWLLAAEWADSIGADIISSSLGYAVKFTYGSDHTYDQMDGKTTIVSKAATIAASKGILVVNSAGNEGNNPWTHIVAPADADSCLTVGAVDSEGRYAFFSSTGPTADGRIKPDVVAMGAKTISLSPYGILSAGNGTSFACPLIAGFAACLWQSSSAVSNMELFNIIKQSGNIASYPNNFVGWGIPSAAIAFKNLTQIDLPQLKPVYENKITVIPNPVSGPFIIRFYNAGGAADAQLNIYNQYAQQIKSMAVKLHSGDNYFGFSSHDLQMINGMYEVQITGVSEPITFKNIILVQD